MRPRECCSTGLRRSGERRASAPACCSDRLMRGCFPSVRRACLVVRTAHRFHLPVCIRSGTCRTARLILLGPPHPTTWPSQFAEDFVARPWARCGGTAPSDTCDAQAVKHASYQSSTEPLLMMRVKGGLTHGARFHIGATWAMAARKRVSQCFLCSRALHGHLCVRCAESQRESTCSPCVRSAYLRRAYLRLVAAYIPGAASRPGAMNKTQR